MTDKFKIGTAIIFGVIVLGLFIASLTYLGHKSSITDTPNYEINQLEKRVDYQAIQTLETPDDAEISYQLVLKDYGKRKYTPFCLTECHLPIKFFSDKTEILDLEDIGHKYLDADGSDLSQCILDYGINVAETRGIYEYEYNEECENVLNANTSQYEEVCQEVKGNLVKKGERLEWQPFSSESLSGNITYLDFWIKKNPDCNLDYVPSLYSQDLPYAWFNSTWQHYRNLTITDDIDRVDLKINFTLNEVMNLSDWASGNFRVLDSNLNELSYECWNSSSSNMNVSCDDTTALYGVFLGNVTAAGTNFQIYFSNSSTVDNAESPRFYSMYEQELGRSSPPSGWTNSDAVKCQMENGIFKASDCYWENVYLGPVTNEMYYMLIGQSNVGSISAYYVSEVDSQIQNSAILALWTGNDYYGYQGDTETDTNMDYPSNTDIYMKAKADTVSSKYDIYNLTDRSIVSQSQWTMRGANNDPFQRVRMNSATGGNCSLSSYWWSAYNFDVSDTWAMTIGAEQSETPAIVYPVIQLYNWNTTSINNYTNGTLQSYYNVSYHSPVSTTLKYYKDEVLQSSLTNYTMINSGNTSKGQVWKLEINSTDGTYSAQDSFNLTINNAPPSVPSQYSPNGTIFTWTNPYNLSCSGSIDIDGDSINYEFWTGNGTNFTIGQNLTMQTYKMPFEFENGTYTWHCQANDGEEANTGYLANTTFYYNSSTVFGSLGNFTNPVVSGRNDTFTFNISWNWIRVSDVAGEFVMNEETFPVTGTDDLTNNVTVFSISSFLPLNASNYVNSFYWNITLTYRETGSTSSPISYPFSQTVQGVVPTSSCTGSNLTVAALLNLSRHHEINDSVLYSDIEATFQLWLDDQTIEDNITFSIEQENTTYTLICVKNPPAGKDYKISGQVRYTADYFDYRDYYFRNTTVDNVTNNVKLYLLDIDLADPIVHHITDQVGSGIQNRIIEVLRYDVGTDTYKLVAMGRSDEDGEDLIYLRKNDVFYRHYIKNETEILLTTVPRKIITDDLYFTISDNPYIEQLEMFDDITYSLSFNNASNNFVCSYSTNEVDFEEFCLKVVKISASNKSMGVLCNTCQSTLSGTLLCDIGNETGSFAGTFYASVNPSLPIKTIYVNRGVFSSFSTALGREGLVITLFTVGVVMLSGLANPFVPIILGVVALLFMAGLGVIKISYIALMILAIMGGFVISRLKQ